MLGTSVTRTRVDYSSTGSADKNCGEKKKGHEVSFAIRAIDVAYVG